MKWNSQPRAVLLALLALLSLVSTCFAQTPFNPFDPQLQQSVDKLAAANSSAAKVIILDRIEALREYVDDPARVTDALKTIANNRNETALVREEANWRLARIALHEGRLQDAVRIADTLGFVRDWVLTAGSCDSQKITAHGISAKTGPLASLSIHRTGDVCLATAFYSSTSQNVAFRFGANDKASLRLNGNLLKSTDAAVDFAFDQRSVGAQLQAGWNTLTVEFSGEVAVKQFGLRTTTLDGSGITFTSDSSRISRNTVAATLKVVDATDLLSLAEKQSGEKKSAEALDTGAALQQIRGLGADRVRLEAAAKLAPTADRWIAVATACVNTDCILNSLKQALQVDPQSSAAKQALANYYFSHGRLEPSRALWREVVAHDPNDFIARKRLADANASLGDESNATADYQKLESGGINSIWLKRELGLHFERAGDIGKAASLLNRVWKSSFDDARVRSALQRLAKDRDDNAALEMLAQIATQLDPSDSQAGPEEANFVVKSALATTTGETSAQLRYASLVSYDQVPAKPHVSISRTNLTAFDEADAPYLVNASKLAADARLAPPHEGANIVVLADVTVERVRDSGLSTPHTQQVFYVANDRGARDYSTRSIQYSDATQRLIVIGARIFKTDGRVIRAEDQGENVVADTSTSMYYDTRSRTLRFPGLQRGDVMELEYRLVPRSSVNPYGNYYGTLMAFQTGLPQRLRRYVLIAPNDRPLNVVEQRMPVRATISHTTTETTYRWDATRIQPLMTEPRGPTLTEVAPYVSASTFANWEQFGRWYAAMVAPQFTLNSELHAAVDQLTSGSLTELEKIHAIHEFVLRNTNYIAMEFGVHSYKPYPVTQVYARRFGDCKDKASLTIALLRAAGIEADMGLVRTRKLGDISDRAITIAVFNHAVAYVPKYDLWLDGTADYAGLRELPLDDQGAMALTVDLNGKATLRRIPGTLPWQNYTHRLVQAQIQTDGKIVFEGSAYTRGEDAPGLRREYELPERQRDTVRANLAQIYPSVQVDMVHVDGAHDLEHDIKVRFSGSLNTFAGQETLTLAPSWLPHKYVDALAALESRSQPLQLPAPWTTEEELHFALPQGAKFQSVPEDEQYETSFGSAAIRYERRAGELVITTSVQFRKVRVEPAEYGAFRDFCSQVEKAFRTEIKIRLAS